MRPRKRHGWIIANPAARQADRHVRYRTKTAPRPVSLSALTRRRQSNDHCEQFDQSDSNHQHRDRYRIVIEPMPLLYIRDTPPWCSNLRTCAHMCRTVSLWGLCYSCVSSCSTSAAMCRGTGGARASYWALRQSPSDSQTLLSRAKTGRFLGDRFTRDWSAVCDADTRENGGTGFCPFADCD
jgi:hypothetical protein